MAKADLVLVGGGGHCKSCIDVIESEGRFHIAGIVDIEEKLRQSILGHEIVACDSDLPDLAKKYEYFFITIGSIKDPGKRIEKFDYLKGLGAQLPVIVAPSAYVAGSSQVEEGTIVMHKAFINAGVHVGKNCIVNTGAIIEHDSTVGDHCNISTGSIVNGTCNLGRGVFVGSNSMLFNNTDIADEVIIGAGSVVTRSIGNRGVYFGKDL